MQLRVKGLVNSLKINSRYLGAVIIAPTLVFIFLGGLPLKIFTLLLSIVGMYEFYKAVKKSDYRTIDIVGYFLLICYYIFNNNFNLLSLLIIFVSFILLLMPIINEKYNFIGVSLTLLGFIYVGVFFSFIYLVANKTNGNYYVWLIFMGSWVTDTFAYYAGRLFGKTKLCPKISPKKTIEGSIGGLLGSTLVCGIFGIVISNYISVFPIYHFFIIGALCGIFSQFGDLVASSIKRFVDIKDYGNLIPGHGGILDRFDSILFSGIIVFYYLTFIIGI